MSQSKRVNGRTVSGNGRSNGHDPRFVMQKGIAPPTRGGRTIYPFKTMKVGQSCKIPADIPKARASNAAWQFNRSQKNIHIACGRWPGESKVYGFWRVK